MSDFASSENRIDNKAWVDHWLRVGPMLERIRREELCNFNHENHLDQIDALLEIGCRFGERRMTSGLVEQQRLFQQARMKAEE